MTPHGHSNVHMYASLLYEKPRCCYMRKIYLSKNVPFFFPQSANALSNPMPYSIFCKYLYLWQPSIQLFHFLRLETLQSPSTSDLILSLQGRPESPNSPYRCSITSPMLKCPKLWTSPVTISVE